MNPVPDIVHRCMVSWNHQQDTSKEDILSPQAQNEGGNLGFFFGNFVIPQHQKFNHSIMVVHYTATTFRNTFLDWSGLQNQRLKQEKSRTAQIPTAVKPFLALPTQSPQLKTYHNNSKVSPHPFQKKKFLS